MDSPSFTHTFQYRPGDRATAVRLRTFMPGFPPALDFTHRGDAWSLELELPADARLEYRIEVDDGRGTHSILDPDNPRSAANPFGENSVHVGPAYPYPDWTTCGDPRGDLREIRVHSRHLGGRRHHVMYSPPGLGPEDPAPLLVVHDGSDYVRYAGLPACLEAMIAAGRIPRLRVLGLNPRVRHQRYIASDQHADHVVEEVIPHVRERVSVSNRVAIMGASLGAVAAWHTSWRHPGFFSALVLQSGTFALEPHPELDDPMYRSISRFMRAALEDPRTDAMAVMQSCGRWESLIDWNRTVAAALSPRSAAHSFVETWTGHDWGAWSGTMDIGLEMAFGDG
ncbi:MAG TPA: alpha/beta hydrolase-fold protein [Acidimicrobiia bacterium]